MGRKKPFAVVLLDGIRRHAELIQFESGYGLSLYSVLGPLVSVRMVGPEQDAMKKLIDEVERVDGISRRGKRKSYVAPGDNEVLDLCEGTQPAMREGDVLDLDAVAEVVRRAGYDLGVTAHT